MSEPGYYLPITLLAIKSLFKLCVDQKPDWPELGRVVIALPVDIAFLSASLIIAILSWKSANASSVATHFGLSIVFCLITTFIWRRCDALYSREKHFSWAFFSFINFILGILPLSYAIKEITP